MYYTHHWGVSQNNKWLFRYEMHTFNRLGKILKKNLNLVALLNLSQLII